jgi:hypothetical protein
LNDSRVEPARGHRRWIGDVRHASASDVYYMLRPLRRADIALLHRRKERYSYSMTHRCGRIASPGCRGRAPW